MGFIQVPQVGEKGEGDGEMNYFLGKSGKKKHNSANKGKTILQRCNQGKVLKLNRTVNLPYLTNTGQVKKKGCSLGEREEKG